MYGFPRPFIPNDVQWNRHQAPYNPQWRPFHGPRAPFRPRNQGYNHRPPMMQGGSEEHWCETCDRGFPTLDLLNKHKLQHQKCNIDGCQFIAHPKVITKHIQMQHSSGLYKKIANLNNPEEIDRWREERRKKYPTKTNIDKRAAELKEKIDRGEKMGLGKKHQGDKLESNKQNRNYNQGQGRKRPYCNDNNHESKFRKQNRKQAPRTPKILPATEENRSLAPFAGIQRLIMDSDEEVDEVLNSNDIVIEDDIVEVIDNAIKKKEEPNDEKLVVCGALSSLMCDYGSSDEEIDDININQKDNKIEISTKLEVKKDIPHHINNAAKKVKNVPEYYNETISNIEIKVKEEIIPEQIPDVTERVKNLPENDKNSSELFYLSSKLDIQKEVDTTKNYNDSEPKEVPKTENAINESNNIGNSDEQSSNQNNKLDLDKHDADIDDNNSEPEEVTVLKNVDPNSIDAQHNNVENETKFTRKRVEIVRKPVYRKPKHKLPSTLIYRLLSKEMKQERNKVLQCIRYIRKKNYFDKSI